MKIFGVVREENKKSTRKKMPKIQPVDSAGRGGGEGSFCK